MSTKNPTPIIASPVATRQTQGSVPSPVATRQTQGSITNPVPILQQDRSSIVTNPFIPNEQKIKEIEFIEEEANKIIEQQYNQNRTTSIKNLSIQNINTNVSSSVIGIIDDLYKKPKNINWMTHIKTILQKEQRYVYIGILCILIALYILLTR